MGQKSEKSVDDAIVFAQEDPLAGRNEACLDNQGNRWKILVVDDEKHVHDITRIALKEFSFEGRSVHVISAYSGGAVKEILRRESDIAMIILDVVMEEEDTGLRLVEFIRDEMKNTAVRIVLRTGQPGKAPEHAVISRYDINEYRTKPEFTAQRLYTSVTACLRSYKSLKTIERDKEGLEAIIQSTAFVFKQTSLDAFGCKVLEQLYAILKIEERSDIRAGYFIGLPSRAVTMIAGRGIGQAAMGMPIERVLPQEAASEYERLRDDGGEAFAANTYIGVFKTREGATSVLFIDGIGGIGSVDRYLLRVYAGNVSIGFDNISLSGEIINTQKEVIHILGEVVETRSQETAHHVTRVAEFCYLLAIKYGMDSKDAEVLRLASPMHDVGKIGVPESILNKPGRLTDQEFEVMRSHARIGHTILNKSNRPIMKAAAITALEHHEKWDGSGYPRGLKGDQIHIYGRIAAIADVFDALSHKRCYKEAWPRERIVSTFQKDAGTHFDPGLVRLFLDHLDDFYRINDKFPE